MKVNCRFCSASFNSPTKSVECPSCGSTDSKDFVFSEDVMPETPQSMMMYDVTAVYTPNFSSELIERTEQVTEYTLESMKKKAFTGIYKSIVVNKELGMLDTTWLQTWYKLALQNPWISQAYDPQFKITNFFECKTLDFLMKKLSGGGWAVGAAFFYKNLAFINQVDGGDEWLIIKEDVPFESYSCGSVINRDKRKFVEDIYKYLNTPKEEIQNFDYKVEIPDVLEFEGVQY